MTYEHTRERGDRLGAADAPGRFRGPGEMRARCRAVDWAATPLGDDATWPSSLRTTAETVLAMGFPAIVLWGPDLVQLYNDAYVPFLGTKHPAALGRPAPACWPEVWPLVEPILARVHAGETVTLEDQLYPLLRRGADAAPEDVHVTLTYVPVRAEDGDVGGVLVTGVDTSAQVNGRAARLDRERLEARLHGVLLETALLLDQVRDAYLLVDADFRVVALNQSAERALGRARGDVVGRAAWETFPASADAEPERRFRRVATERVEAHFVHRYVGDRHDVHLEIDAYPARNGGVAIFWRDVTERLRLLADTQAARVDAEARAATLAAVIDSIPDAVLVARADAVTLANRAARDQLGVPPTDELQPAAGAPHPLEDLLLDPATGAPVPLAATPIGRAFGGERSHGLFLLRARATGAVRPVRAAAAPIVGPDGAILGAVSVVTDMTRMQEAAAERERLLQELELERARLAYVFEHAPAFLAVLRGPAQVFEFAHAAFEQLVGHRQVRGRSVADALPEMRDQHFIALLDRVLATGEPYVGREVPIALARTAGSPPETRFVDFVYLPLLETDGRRSGVIAHGTDVTEQVEARREIERLLGESERARADAEAARGDAEAANRTKGEFLAVMSHELRTPLNAIGGYAELMELGIRGPVTAQQREDLARIQKSQRHLLGLINGVLNYARAEAGAVHYEVRDVPLDQVLATCEALIAPQARAKRIALHFAACDAALVARADREKLQQIVLNLLSNAVKFTGPDGEVTLACARDRRAGSDPVILVRVSDTGRGIAASALERVFEPFVQVDSRLTRTQEGIGLGLAISRDLARGMGGDLAAVSEAGVGSTFTLVLPAA